jgi:hypothetical protein
VGRAIFTYLLCHIYRNAKRFAWQGTLKRSNVPLGKASETLARGAMLQLAECVEVQRSALDSALASGHRALIFLANYIHSAQRIAYKMSINLIANAIILIPYVV